jgi:hypothetical protein
MIFAALQSKASIVQSDHDNTETQNILELTYALAKAEDGDSSLRLSVEFCGAGCYRNMGYANRL